MIVRRVLVIMLKSIVHNVDLGWAVKCPPSTKINNEKVISWQI